jgi:hypothetical protein
MKGSYELEGGEFVTYPNRKFSKLIVSFWYEVFLGVTSSWAEIAVSIRALLPCLKCSLYPNNKCDFKQAPGFRDGSEQSNVGQVLS